jgi:perosamine synthetase
VAIFNSLGSNYSGRLVWQSLLARPSKRSRQQLCEYLAKQYGGTVTLTYKGREALELALKRSGLPATTAVAINGFTCYVVYRAIERAAYQAVFVDLAPGQLNFGLAELRAVHTQRPELKAVIIQNTLGYPADITDIATYCAKHKLLLIEDLAHSAGVSYSDGRRAGTIGDFVMLSFSQDKPSDIVAGGALIDRRVSSTGDDANDKNMTLVSRWQRLKNRSYPFWTMLIRGGYDWQAGRLLHYALKRLKWLATPMHDNLEGPHAMSDTAAQLLVARLPTLDDEISHRRAIAAIYKQRLPSELQLTEDEKATPSYLRFPLMVDDPQQLSDYVRHHHIYIGDRWYDAPIVPRRYLERTSYSSGLCPQAEQLSSHIVNLPTHGHVTPEIAERICAKINQWQASKSNR